MTAIRRDQLTERPTPLLSGGDAAGNQRASRAYGPANQGHACRADGELEVSAALAGRRIEPPGKTELAVLHRQLELPLLRPVRPAVPYRDRYIYIGATAVLQQQADLAGRPDLHGWFGDGMDAWPYDERASGCGVAVRPGCSPRQAQRISTVLRTPDITWGDLEDIVRAVTVTG